MFRFPLCLLLICFLCAFTASLGNVGMLGPVDLIFKNMENCDPEQHVLEFWINQRKYNRSLNVLDITWSSPYPIDEHVQLEFNGSMKKEGGYKPGAFYFKDVACKALERLLGDIFKIVLQKADLDGCPIVAGDHAALDFYFDNEQFTVPQLYGEYKMDIFIYKDGNIESCYIAYFEFVPKNS